MAIILRKVNSAVSSISIISGWRRLVLHDLGDRAELHIAGSLVYASDLAVAEELFCQEISREAYASEPLNALAGRLFGHLTRIQLGHAGLLDEWEALLLHSRGIIDHKFGTIQLRGKLSVLVLHPLEVGDPIAKLPPLHQVRHGHIQASLRYSYLLGADADPTLV